MPRVYQQVDWSNGGDGIVVRDAIKSMADLRGKTIAWRRTRRRISSCSTH